MVHMTMALPRNVVQEWVYKWLYDITGGDAVVMSVIGWVAFGLFMIGCIIVLRYVPNEPGELYDGDDAKD